MSVNDGMPGLVPSDDDDDDDDEYPLIEDAEDIEDDSVNNGFIDSAEPEEGFVELHISDYALRETAATADSDAEVTGGEAENEAEDFLDNICILTDYWYRPASMKDFHYAFVRENFHLVRNKPPESSGLRMQLGHPNPEKGYWLRNEHQRRRCLVFVGGKVS
jgi:hypothetical protein